MSGFSRIPGLRRASSGAALFASWLFLATCSDSAGPASGAVATFSVASAFTSDAAGIVDVDRVRILLTRLADEAVVRDTVVDLGPSDTVVDLSVRVVLSDPAEQFELWLALIDPVGDTVFRGGPVTVTPTATGAPIPVEVELVYTGVGANAAAVRILTPDTVIQFDASIDLIAEALDASQSPIPGTPIAWSSLDAQRVFVSDRADGIVVGGTQRGPARIVAQLLTGPADTMVVTAQPPPSTILADSGDGQVGLEGTPLPRHIVARVLGADGLGVEGIPVQFTVTQGGGSLWSTVIPTDTGGRAANDFTLGTAGPNVVEAAVASVPGTVATFSATALASGSQTFYWAVPQAGEWTVAANWVPATVPGVGDTAVIAVDGAYTVQTGNAAITVDAVTVGSTVGTQTLVVSNFAGASLTVDRELVVEPGGTLLISGTLAGAAPASISGAADLTNAATLAGSAPFVVEPGGTLRLSATTVNPTISARPVVVHGVLDCYGRVAPRQGATLTIRSTGTWAAQNGCLIDAQNEPAVVNEGLLSVVATGGAGLYGDLVNRGTIDIVQGSFVVQGGFAHESSGVLQGAGFVNLAGLPGTVTLAGRIEPGTAGISGRLDLFGDLPLASTTEIGIDLAGPTDHDQLVASGVATLDGTLRVDVAAGYTPTAGTRFPVLAFASRTGDFVQLDVNGLDPQLRIVREYATDTLYLRVQAASQLPIVFAGDSAGGLSSGIFTVNPDGTGLTNIIAIPTIVQSLIGERAIYPRWSPDYSQIAYSIEEPAGPSTQSHLFVASSDGVTIVPVVSDTGAAGAIWSLNGAHLAFACFGYDAQTLQSLQDVCIINDITGPVASLAGRGDGSGKVFVTDLVANPAGRAGGIAAFAWDPTNPDRIAFVRDSLPPTGGFPSSRIYTAVFDGTSWTVQPLSTDVLDVGGGPLQIVSSRLTWSPDGSHLAFAAMDAQYLSDIFVINRDGTGFTRLTATADFDDDPLYSPDGTKLLFTRTLSASGFDAWMMNADGSNVHQVTAENVGDYDVMLLGYDWSPDGSEIVLTGFEIPYGSQMIYKIPATTTAATYFTDRVLIGRGSVGQNDVLDIQPNWRP